MPSDAEEEIEAEVLPLVLSLAPCEGAGCCPRLPVPWHWGRPGTIVASAFIVYRAPKMRRNELDAGAVSV